MLTEACLKALGAVMVVALIASISNGYCNCRKVVDLSWDFGNETVYWPRPGGKRFEFTKVVAHENRGYWYAVNEFCAGEHGGTHFDAPYHFSKHAWKVGDVPVERLIAKGATIDLSKRTPAIKELLVEHLEEWQSVNGEFENNTVLLIKFGWSQHYHNYTKYFGLDSSSAAAYFGSDSSSAAAAGKVKDENVTMDFPGISEGAARWIAAQNGIVGVGLDTPSVDPGITVGYETHRIFGANQIYGLENVKLLVELPAKGYTLVVLPMNIKYGTGAPLRIVALLNED